MQEMIAEVAAVAKKNVRLPLNVGVSALWNLNRAALALLPGCYIIAGLYLVLLGFREGSLFWYFSYAFAGLFAVMAGWQSAKQVFAQWPSDAVITDSGLIIERDPLPFFLRFINRDYRPRLHFSWHELQHWQLKLEEHKVERYTLWRLLFSGITVPLGLLLAMFGGDKILDRIFNLSFSSIKYTETTLYLEHTGKTAVNPQNILLARGENALDTESVHALHDTLKNRMHAHSDTGRAQTAARLKRNFLNADTTIERLICPRCGSANPPEEREATSCLYCRESLPVPAELRAKLSAIRETTENDTKSETMLRSLLRQGKSHHASLLLKLGGLTLLVMVPLIYLGYEWFDKRSMANIILMLIFALFFATTYCLVFFVTRASLVNRRALRLITLGFAAIPPADGNSPHLCRGCGAALRPPSGGIVTNCLYCSTQNILGLDFRPEVQPSAEQQHTLAKAFASRRRERIKWILCSLLCIPMLLVSLIMGFYIWWWANSPIGEVAACANENPEYCFRLADRFLTGDGVPMSIQDSVQHRFDGLKILEKRCGRKNPVACTDAGYQYFTHTHLKSDAKYLYERGCRYREATSCNNLGIMFQFGQNVQQNLKSAAGYFKLACDYGLSDGCERGKKLGKF